eukprot:CAMPEP_0174880560 /NCGR_PEP_ID=MMETSP1114-20130205/83822_1 /TAXON_ID=312471 /ORGANISM="Neobodo designis, Strain CCAP 1951/1" /LENGTH=631 /DNA_ID=CAMNT_0016115955 /DNA_START=71 /DNA_END=1964 /DNA_ORIENTATION=+
MVAPMRSRRQGPVRQPTVLYGLRWRAADDINAAPATDPAVLQEQVAALAGELDALAQQHRQLVEHILAQQQNAAAGGVPDSFVPPSVLRTVVKIFAGVAAPNHILPWQRKLQTNVSGTGFVVDKKRRLIATNTHVIGKATSIQVRRHGAGHRHVAETVFIAADCDFALLRVDEDAFWRDVEEAQFDGVASEELREQGGLAALCSLGPSCAIPDLQANVKVVGFPWGGEQVSITSGVVSRVDMTSYGGADSSLLGIQIDAAINSGNSGGPALVDSKVIGIAFQTLIAASNIGYLIPACIAAVAARAFMRALTEHHRAAGADPHVQAIVYHEGFSSVGIGYQDLTNDKLRRVHGLTAAEQTGCLVEHVFKRCSGEGVLKVGDVICRVNGMAIADDGTVQWKNDQRVSFSHFVRSTRPGDTFELEVLRGGESMTLTVPAKVPFSIVPNHTYSDKYLEQLPYRVFGGCVFTELTMGFLLEWGDPDWFNNAPRHLTGMLFPKHTDEQAKPDGSAAPVAERDSIVVLSQVLPHAVNRGYASEHFTNRFVDKVNGTTVRSFEHFNALLEEACANAKGHADVADVTILLSNGSMNLTMALDAAPAAEADELVMRAYGIPALVRFPGGRDPAKNGTADET